MTDGPDLVTRLRAHAKKFDQGPPDGIGWGHICADCADAADEIERLQRLAGAVSPGESFQELRDQAKTPQGSS